MGCGMMGFACCVAWRGHFEGIGNGELAAWSRGQLSASWTVLSQGVKYAGFDSFFRTPGTGISRER